VVANAKVVMIFSAALAGTFVSAAMEKMDPSGWDEWALILMGLTLIPTVVVVLFPPRHRQDEQDDDVYDVAKSRAMWAYRLLVVQVFLSLATIVAVIAVVRPDWL
jgi:hypothetical protein